MSKEIARRQRGAQPGNHNARKHGFYSAPAQERESDHPTMRRLQQVGRAIDDTRDRIIAAINKDPETAVTLLDALTQLARLNQEELDCLNDLRKEAIRIRMRQQLNNPHLTLRHR